MKQGGKENAADSICRQLTAEQSDGKGNQIFVPTEMRPEGIRKVRVVKQKKMIASSK
jgi:hypothetical protein